MRRRAWRRILSKALVYIIWIVLTLVTLSPIYWLFIVSARSRVELFDAKRLYQTTIFWDNYIRPLFRDLYGGYLRNSLIIATANTVLVLVLAVMATYALSRYQITGADNIFFWTITNRMAPAFAFMLPMYLLYTWVLRIGPYRLFDSYLGLILAYCVFNLPFAIWLLKGMIDAIPLDLDEAAMVDGCTTLGIIWRIIVPLARPGIAITALLTWIFAWNEYLFASVLTSTNARTITTGLAEFVTVVGTNWGEMAAMAVLCLVPALLFLAFVQRYIVAGLTFGAVKE
ncbi:MAG: carbohydrate ABC transporter permease [Anaerolineae bacterium]